ncbi:hypothetical protein DN730_00835 [Marinomonas piezotolerans]|uniref:NRDE family protein n=1 Tax=Marinomonas piezotolerans TaxID=2213058 RepID=A0A370UD00_9GAMM|nr:NRDE family protein [Marinomonas piezotolerans]RDL45629.1 hypothetical protein DN730_00835 [Marinomonas piezotolerans]
MCSVTWQLDDEGYQVFFNRDEQKSRALGLPPQQLQLNDIRVLMPIDPVGQGSWISVNELGLTLCLLNNYQGWCPKGTLISRGQLLKGFSSKANTTEIEEAFYALDLMQYAPFVLVAFDPSLTKTHGDVLVFEWNGRTTQIYTRSTPLFSSGVDLDRVVAKRQATYERFIETGRRDYIHLHASHHDEQLHTSFCMHRADAHTVSFTHVAVTPNTQKMSYVPGAPCTQLDEVSLAKHSIYLPSNDAMAS